MLIDIHTHHNNVTKENYSIYNCMAFETMNSSFFSVGIHPWSFMKAEFLESTTWEWVIKESQHPNCIAIGETGIDFIRGRSIALQSQIELFEKHIHLANELQKPLIIHNVKGIDYILHSSKLRKPHHLPWILHSFFGSYQQAYQLYHRHHIRISLNFRALAHLKTKSELKDFLRLGFYLETDTDSCSIQQVYESVVQTNLISMSALQDKIKDLFVQDFQKI